MRMRAGYVKQSYIIVCNCTVSKLYVKRGSGAFSGKILLVRIVENNKIDAYFRAGYVK